MEDNTVPVQVRCQDRQGRGLLETGGTRGPDTVKFNDIRDDVNPSQFLRVFRGGAALSRILASLLLPGIGDPDEHGQTASKIGASRDTDRSSFICRTGHSTMRRQGGSPCGEIGRQ